MNLGIDRHHRRISFAIGVFCLACMSLVALGSSGASAPAQAASALDQYVEEIPDGSGTTPTSEVPRPHPEKVLGEKTYKEFRAQGAEGIAAAGNAASGLELQADVSKGGPNNFPGNHSLKDVEGDTTAETSDLGSDTSAGMSVLGASTGLFGQGSSPLLLLVFFGVILTMVFTAVKRSRQGK
jgi:hypothetical protein